MFPSMDDYYGIGVVEHHAKSVMCNPDRPKDVLGLFLATIAR